MDERKDFLFLACYSFATRFWGRFKKTKIPELFLGRCFLDAGL